MMKRIAIGALGILALAACQPHEGPIDVILEGLTYDEVELSWAKAGSDAFELCGGVATDPEAVVGCGPYGVGKPGDYVVRAEWGELVAEQEVTLERDGDTRANVAIVFAPEDFE